MNRAIIDHSLQCVRVSAICSLFFLYFAKIFPLNNEISFRLNENFIIKQINIARTSHAYSNIRVG